MSDFDSFINDLMGDDLSNVATKRPIPNSSASSSPANPAAAPASGAVAAIATATPSATHATARASW
jgi:hypothetical protein